MKTTLLFCLICLLPDKAVAQSDPRTAEQLAASFDKSKIKRKAKGGVEVNMDLVTRHQVADVDDLSFYQGRYVGVEGTYEITLTVDANQQITGQLTQPDATGKTQILPLRTIRIQDGLFSAEVVDQSLTGVFINQGRVENGQERISFGLGITNPQLAHESMNYTRIFCKRE